MTLLKIKIPTVEEVKQKVYENFGISPCKFQIQATIAQLTRSKEKTTDLRRGVLCIAGTGSGKSLAFYMPFIFNDNGILIMVTPLNVLAEQMAQVSAKLKITVANLTGDNSSEELYKVKLYIIVDMLQI